MAPNLPPSPDGSPASISSRASRVRFNTRNEALEQAPDQAPVDAAARQSSLLSAPESNSPDGSGHGSDDHLETNDQTPDTSVHPGDGGHDSTDRHDDIEDLLSMDLSTSAGQSKFASHFYFRIGVGDDDAYYPLSMASLGSNDSTSSCHPSPQTAILEINFGTLSSCGAWMYASGYQEPQTRFAGRPHTWINRFCLDSVDSPPAFTLPQFTLSIGCLRVQQCLADGSGGDKDSTETGQELAQPTTPVYSAFVSVFPEDNEKPSSRAGGLWLLFNDALDEYPDSDSDTGFTINEAEYVAGYRQRRQEAYDMTFGQLAEFKDIGCFDVACVLEDWTDLLRGPVDANTIANTMKKRHAFADIHLAIAMEQETAEVVAARLALQHETGE